MSKWFIRWLLELIKNNAEVDWSRILNKPTVYPPEAHQHDDADLLSIDWAKILNKPSLFKLVGSVSPSSNVQSISISGLSSYKVVLITGLLANADGTSARTYNMRFNGDTGANYYWIQWLNSNNNITSDYLSGDSAMRFATISPAGRAIVLALIYVNSKSNFHPALVITGSGVQSAGNDSYSICICAGSWDTGVYVKSIDTVEIYCPAGSYIHYETMLYALGIANV